MVFFSGEWWVGVCIERESGGGDGGGYDREPRLGGVYSKDGKHDTLDEMIRLFFVGDVCGVGEGR
jgi:hypothetical protein